MFKSKKRTLILSLSIIMICLSLLIGTTYSLFTDSVSVSNHLQAGTLDIELTRTNLKYTILNENGFLQQYTNDEELDFTGTVKESIFGIDEEEVLIVPGSYIETDLKLTNNGNVALKYVVKIVLNKEANELSNQLQVTVTHEDGTKKTFMLSELSSNEVLLGTMDNGDFQDTFTINITFVNDETYNENVSNEDDKIINNLAQSNQLSFDLVVEAVQNTVVK